MIDANNKLDYLLKLCGTVSNKNIIYDTDDGRYIFYEEYSIQKIDKETLVTRFRDEKEFRFYKQKNAVVWAILDKHNKFFEATRVLELDKTLESIKVDIYIHSSFKKQKDLEKKSVFAIKHQHDIQRQKQFQREMNKYIILADICQQRGFQNELKRITGQQ